MRWIIIIYCIVFHAFNMSVAQADTLKKLCINTSNKSLTSFPYSSDIESEEMEIMGTFYNSALEQKNKKQLLRGIRYKVGGEGKVINLVAGKILNITYNKIEIIEKNANGSFIWVYQNIDVVNFNELFVKKIAGLAIKKGEVLGLSKSLRARAIYDCYHYFSPNKTIYFFDLLLAKNDASGNRYYIDPIAYINFKDFVPPKIEKVFLVEADTHKIFDGHRFFEKPLVREKIKVLISANDRMPIYKNLSNRWIPQGVGKFPLSIAQSKVLLYDIRSKKIVYSRRIIFSDKLLAHNNAIEDLPFVYNITFGSRELIYPLSIYNSVPLIDVTYKNKMDFGINTIDFPNGIYKIIVKVWDYAGNISTTDLEIMFNN